MHLDTATRARSGGTERTTPDRAPALTGRSSPESVRGSGGSVKMHRLYDRDAFAVATQLSPAHIPSHQTKTN